MNSNQPIAIVGMSGIFPAALDLDTFWQNILDKVDATREVVRGRWIVEPEAIYDPEPKADKAYSKRACLVEGFEFDGEGFDLDRDLLKALDPMHQMALHVGRQVVAADRAPKLDFNRTGVIVAAIALPTDGASRFARQIVGSAFEKHLFSGTDLESKSSVSLPQKAQRLAARVTALPAAKR